MRRASSPSFAAGGLVPPDLPPVSVVPGGELPASPEVECLLLGSVLADDSPASWALACNLGVRVSHGAERVTCGAFADSRHEAVWIAIDALHRAGTAAVDLATVAEHLRATGQLEAAGGWAHLGTLGRGAPTSAHARFAAESVVLLWHRRTAIFYAARLRSAALESADRAAFVEAAGTLGQRLIRLGRREAARTLAETYAVVQADAAARIDGRVDRRGWITSGSDRFDRGCRLFGSAREDHFIIFAGGSGHGKSVALRNIAAANLRQGKRVLSYSRETSIEGFVEMLVSAETGVDLLALEHLPKDHAARFYAEFERQCAAYADRLLFCVEHTAATPLVTVEDICDHARAFVHLHGAPDLVLVDYLQLFGARKRVMGNSREALVAHVSHELQALQREIGCVMITAAQLNESGLNEMRQVKRDDETGKVIHRMPRPGDLRESQAAYHDADRVIFLYKPPVDCTGAEQVAPGTPRPEIWWFQEKRRRGAAGQHVRFWFEKRSVRFVEASAAEEADGERATLPAAVVPKGQRVSAREFKPRE